MFGFRPEGRVVKGLDPITRLTPYIMIERSDAQCFSTQYVDSEILSKFIREKRDEGVRISVMEIVIAAYVRTVSQFPALNRFVVGRSLYARKELCVSFVVSRVKSQTEFLETTVKVYFDPYDTIYDVSRKVNEGIEANKPTGVANKVDKVAGALFAIPGFVRLAVAVCKGLDRIGWMPRALIDVSPFHTSMFITNMASLNMNELHHHLYNFGTTTLFLGLGKREPRLKVSLDGKLSSRRYYPLATVSDERVAAGAMYGMAFDLFNTLLRHPERLEEPPETVRYDPRAEYRYKEKKSS